MIKTIDNPLIESVSRILADEIKGSQITTMFHALSLPDFDKINNRPVTSTKWRRINESLIVALNKGKSSQPLLKVIEYVMNPQNYIDKPGDCWNSLKRALNSHLIFYGFEVNDAGKVQVIDAPISFTDAKKRLKSFNDKLSVYDIHEELLIYCREELFVDDYFHAIFEASKGVLDQVRKLSELSDDGNSLIDKAFINKHPTVLIRNNMLQTLTEVSEYNGLKSLLKTIVYFYRNPQAHESRLYNPKSETDAITAFNLMSLAFRILDNCVNVRDI